MILIVDTFTELLNYSQTQQLDGVEYTFGFRWHEREASWYLNITDQDGNPLAMGIRLVVGFPLLRRFRSRPAGLIPAGSLLCVDMSGANREIETAGDLRTRVLLTYRTADEGLQ